MSRIYSADMIKEKLDPIFRAAPIERAILFGSYAKGVPTVLSDVDIVIDSKGKIKGIDFFGVLEDVTAALGKTVDLIEFSQITDGGRVQREIAESGVIIYERNQ